MGSLAAMVRYHNDGDTETTVLCLLFDCAEILYSVAVVPEHWEFRPGLHLLKLEGPEVMLLRHHEALSVDELTLLGEFCIRWLRLYRRD